MFYMAARLKVAACVGLPMPKVTFSFAIYIYYWRAKLRSQHLQHKITIQAHLTSNLITKQATPVQETNAIILHQMLHADHLEFTSNFFSARSSNTWTLSGFLHKAEFHFKNS